MKTTYSVTKAQAKLPTLLREAEHGLISITKHDETVAYEVSRDRMEALIETMEILANPEAMNVLAKDKRGKLKYHPLSALDEA